MKIISTLFTAIILTICASSCKPEEKPANELSSLKYRIIYETFDNNSFDLCIINADGTGKKKITDTPDIHEMYPKVSPDGKIISYVEDTGEGRDRKRDLYIMNLDGSGRKLISKDSREQCWSPDGKYIAFVKSESSRRFSISSWSTKGLSFYDMITGNITEHQNKSLEHLYALAWSRDGKYITATVLGGMGFRHTNIAIDVKGSKFFLLNIIGCRPEFSHDNTMIGWGRADNLFNIAKIDLSKPVPVEEKDKINFLQVDKGKKIYHLDWSPDGKYIAFSSGPAEGEQHVGGTAKGWNINIVDVETKKWYNVTTDGNQNKEPEWIQ
jgi:dipeptidyl aminopeptidase/acylaminoacyl peptidase